MATAMVRCAEIETIGTASVALRRSPDPPTGSGGVPEARDAGFVAP
jgi:hypothetical protein